MSTENDFKNVELDIDNKSESDRRHADRKPYSKLRKMTFWQKFVIKRLFPRFENSLDIEMLKREAKTKSLVFVLSKGGLLEQWYLEYLLTTNDVCTVDFVNRKGALNHFCEENFIVSNLVKLYQTLRKQLIIHEKSLGFFYATLRKRGHSILFFNQDEYRNINELGNHERYFKTITDVSIESEVPVLVVPVVFLWRRSQVKEKSVFNLFFGSSVHPGYIRKFLFFFIRDRVGFLREATSVNVQEFLKSVGTPSPIHMTRKFRRTVIASIADEMRAIIGPAFRSRGLLIESIMSNPEFVAEVNAISREKSESFTTLMDEAMVNLKSIASDYNFYLLEFVAKVAAFFSRQLYDRVVYDRKKFNQLKELSGKNPIVFTPSHRSHVDYLLLSSMFFWEGYAPPMVAAGINLNFWPIGMLLRKGGAFYIRRSFKGDRLYSECLRHYLEYLLKNGYNQEFFIEGGRSRTGKLRYPKYGLLKYYVQALSRGVVNDMFIAPISICYDTVAETSSYSREQSGGKKKKEGLADLVHIKRALKRRYGCAYVQFGNAFSLAEYIQKSGVDIDAASEDELRSFLKKLSFHIMREIDKSTIATPVSLVATALLASKNSGLYIDDLKKNTRALYDTLKARNVPCSIELENDFDNSILCGLETMVKGKNVSENFLTGIDNEDERVFYVDNNKRLDTNYYKNNIINFFVVRSITMLAIKVCQNDKLMDIQYFWENVNFIKNLLKKEFFFSEKNEFKKEVLDELATLVEGDVDLGAITTFEGLEFRTDFDKDLVLRILLPLFESYYIVTRVLEKMTSNKFNKKDLLQKIKLMNEKLEMTGEVDLLEAHSEVNYSNALSLFESMSVLEKFGDERQIKYDQETSGTLSFVRGNLKKFIALLK